jgi:hypothetical protein
MTMWNDLRVVPFAIPAGAVQSTMQFVDRLPVAVVMPPVLTGVAAGLTFQYGIDTNGDGRADLTRTLEDELGNTVAVTFSAATGAGKAPKLPAAFDHVAFLSVVLVGAGAQAEARTGYLILRGRS